MSDIDLKNIRYNRKEVGKTFTSSKILHIWEFNLNGKYHKIQFYDSRLSYKRKIILDDSVLLYEKDSSDFFLYKFYLAGYKFELSQIGSDKYDIVIDGTRCKTFMTNERDNEEREIDEYNERALKYNGSNYYEGMEYKIIERQKEREREREKDVEDDEDEKSDDILDNIDINQIKKNIDNTMNKVGKNQNNNNFFDNGNNNNNQAQFFNRLNNNNNNYNNNENINNKNSNNYFSDFNNNRNNNNMNQGINYNYNFMNNNNNNISGQYSNNNINNLNNNGYNNNYKNEINFNERNFNNNNFNPNLNNINNNNNLNNQNNFLNVNDMNNDNNNSNNYYKINNNNNNQFDTMDNNTNSTQTESFFNTNLSRMPNKENKRNTFKDEIIKSGLVNLNNLFEEPKNKNSNYQKNYENYNFKNNDDSFEF